MAKAKATIPEATELRAIELGEWANGVAFMPDGARALASGFRSTTRWDLATGTPVASAQAHRSTASATVVSAGKRGPN